MSKRYSVALQRAVQIELLRAQADLQRQTLAMHSQSLMASLDPREHIEALLGGSQTDLLQQGVSLVSRYPFLLSLASNALTSSRGRRVLGVGAGVAGVASLLWLISKRSTTNARQ
jgi:hypothetical protein